MFPTLDDHDSANFNEFPPRRFDVDSGHNDESTAGNNVSAGDTAGKIEFNALTGSRSLLIGFVVAKVPGLEVLCPFGRQNRLAVRARGL